MTRRTVNITPAARTAWTDAAPIEVLRAGRSLVIEADRPFVLHFGLDGWQGVADRASAPFGSVHRVLLRRADLKGSELNFTRYYPGDDRWEGADHVMRIGGGRQKSIGGG